MPSRASNQDPASEEPFTRALELFNLTLPLHPTTLYHRYQELLVTWHPHRYANLTNNPAKYMQMYKKGEAMTKEIQAAYKLLKEWIENHGHAPSSV